MTSPIALGLLINNIQNANTPKQDDNQGRDVPVRHASTIIVSMLAAQSTPVLVQCLRAASMAIDSWSYF